MINIFRDRTDAGRQLAGKLLQFKDIRTTTLAIPMGGVPVACEVAHALHSRLDLVLPRKLPIPWNPEAGFGAITIDGSIVLNRQLVDTIHITKAQIEVVSEMIKVEIERSNAALRGDKPPPDLEGRTAIIVDDGLASGYTMLAAIRHVRSLNPKSVIAAAPVASSQAARLVEGEADELVVITVSSRIPFAVAEFYLEWRDLTEREVKEYLSTVWQKGVTSR